MGQSIKVSTTVVGDVLIVDGDRSLTGQDGAGYSSAEEAAGDARFPGRLAARIFDGDDAARHVFVASNQVVIRRSGGWDEDAVDSAAGVVSDFFVFYR